MCYTNTIFQFKVLGQAWEVVNQGETVTHEITEVYPRWAQARELPEPITVEIEPQLYTVVAGHTCPSEWGSWHSRSGFLTVYQGLHTAEELGFVGEITWKQDGEHQSGPFEHPDLIEDYSTPYGDYDAGMCDLAVKLIQVTGVNPNHLLFWTGYGREWGPVLTKRVGKDRWDSFWNGFAAAKEVDPDPWTVWYDLRKPDAFYPNLIHLSHCETPVAAVRDLVLAEGWPTLPVIEETLKRHFGAESEYRDWQKGLWQTEWPPMVWVPNALVQLEKALERTPSAESWEDKRYLVVDDFGVQVLVSHQPALALLRMLQEIDLVSYNQIFSLADTEKVEEE